MDALVIAKEEPKTEKNCLYAKVETLALDGTSPEVGDSVDELAVAGKVISIDNGIAKIELTTLNGEPLASTEKEEEKKEPSMDDEYKSLKEDAEKEDYGQ